MVVLVIMTVMTTAGGMVMIMTIQYKYQTMMPLYSL